MPSQQKAALCTARPTKEEKEAGQRHFQFHINLGRAAS